MTENGIASLGDVLQDALSGVELNDQPVELTDKQKRKLELQKQRQEEAVAREAGRREEALRIAKIKEAQREATLKTVMENYKPSPQSTPAPAKEGSSTLTWQEYREKGIEFWTLISDRLSNPDYCTDDALSVIHPEKFIRGYENSRKFLFCNEVPVRPSFFIPDKYDPAFKYPAWLSFPKNCVMLEFGNRIPLVWDKTLGKRVPNPSGSEVPFFSILKFDEEKSSFVRDVFAFEGFPDEFSRLMCTLTLFFDKITPISKKRFSALKHVIESNVPGVFDRGQTDPEVHKLITSFLRSGGSSDTFETIFLKRNEVAVFDSEAAYILVNTSHRKAGVINPEQCLIDEITGFTRGKDGRISTFLAQSMSVIEFKGSSMTIVHGA